MKYIGAITGAIVSVAWAVVGTWLFSNDLAHWEMVFWTAPFVAVIGGLLGNLFDIGRRE